MGFVQGQGRTQGTLFPATLEELIPDDPVCRVIDGVCSHPEICSGDQSNISLFATIVHSHE
jgi:hypothetical protein